MQAIHIVENKSALHLNRALNDSAVIDLFYGTHLTNYADLPKSLYGATGAFIKNKMLVCGGLEGASYCKKSTRGRGCERLLHVDKFFIHTATLNAV